MLTLDGETLETTAEHPFYVVETNEWSSYLSAGKWIDAADLQVGDDVRRADGSTGEVRSMQVVAQSQPMYNLTVDQAHTFFVGAGQWLVHNCGDLIAKLGQAGVKHNPKDIVRISELSGGKIVFLENGNATSGLQHILTAHGNDFANRGIAQDQIPDLIMDALSQNKIVGYQGSGAGRPIYEVVFQGKKQHVAVTVGSNGYIVGANPATVQ